VPALRKRRFGYVCARTEPNHRSASGKVFPRVRPRAVEHVIRAENGLPNGSAKNAVDGYRWLVGGRRSPP